MENLADYARLLDLSTASTRYEGLSVRALVADFAACGHYRVINPLTYLKKHGADVKYFQYCNLSDLMDADVIIAQRQYDENVANGLLAECLALGKLVIYEADDNFHALEPSNQVYGIYHTNHRLSIVSRLISQLDGLTVSTRELAGDYSMAKTVEVLPNSIDFEMRDWTSMPEDKDPNFVYIMFSGGATHRGDLPILKEPIKAILKKYDYVKFCLYTNLAIAKDIVDEFELNKEQVHIIPPVPFNDYPSNLGWADIGVVPLENTRFNSAKSCLRYLELGARKTPVVASVVPPYAMVIKNGINGYTANSTEEWIAKLSHLIEDKDARERMGNVAYQTVRNNYDQANTVHMWPTAWQNIALVKQRRAEPKIWPVVYGRIKRNDKCPCGCGQKYKKCEIYPAYGM